MTDHSKTIWIVLLSAVALMFLLSACAKSECKVASDCGANTKCVTYACTSDNECKKNVKPNCCGNGICEAKAGENGCTCDDCKACDSLGKVKYNVTTSRGQKTMEAKYARYVCDGSDCVIGVAPGDANELKLTATVEERNYFRIEALSTFNSPFNVAKDKYSVRLRLEDLNPAKVSGGITITSIKVLNQNYVMGEKLLTRPLSQVGDLFTEEFDLTSAQMLTEEEATLSLNVDYTYTPLDSAGSPLPVKRDSKKVTITTSGRITVVKP